MKTIVSLNGRIFLRLLFMKIRRSSQISWRWSKDNRHRIRSFNFSTMEIQIKLDKSFHLSLNKSINSIKTIFNEPFQVNSSISSSSCHFFSLLSGGIPSSSISVSSFDSSLVDKSHSNATSSSREKFIEELNHQAKIREFLFQFQLKQSINTFKSLEAQATSLSQSTQSSNQLTHHIIVRFPFSSSSRWSIGVFRVILLFDV